MGKKKFNYGQVTTEPTYEALAVAANGFALGAVADLEPRNCQPALNFDRKMNLKLTTSTAIEPNACYRAFFFLSV